MTPTFHIPCPTTALKAALFSWFTMTALATGGTGLHAHDAAVSETEDTVCAARGEEICFQGRRYVLSEHCILLDGDLSDEEAKGRPYVFNSFDEIVENLRSGTDSAHRMTVLIRPGVYWIDDPDDPAVRMPQAGEGTPIGRHIRCEWLRMVGLSERADDVVLACSRGQMQGAYGNFTMFAFHGDGLQLFNLTLGNFCNVDLAYPRQPERGRKRRSDVITQAQIAFVEGDRTEAHNCRFLSRLNTCPLNGGRRTLFDHCYFECTDDALEGRAVYLSCSFALYSSRPFYSTAATGAVMLDCDFRCLMRGGTNEPAVQYLTKAGGQLALVDCRFSAAAPLGLEWTPEPDASLRCYQSGVTWNGAPVSVGSRQPCTTVVMDSLPLLEAYKITVGGRTIYNSYNLLAGDDGWDPMGVKPVVEREERRRGRPLHGLPVALRLQLSQPAVETRQAAATARVEALRSNDYEAALPAIDWHTDRPDLLRLSCEGPLGTLACISEADSAQTAVVSVSSPFGLEAAAPILAQPAKLPPPAFTSLPQVSAIGSDTLAACYALRLDGRDDRSAITWYRCLNENGARRVPVSVSRHNVPERFYRLKPADRGHTMLVEVAPRHIRSDTGSVARATIFVPQQQGRSAASLPHELATDFHDFPTTPQPLVGEGLWTLDGYKPADTDAYPWRAVPDCWRYGTAPDGARGEGLVQTAKGARLRYTPTADETAGACAMSVTLRCDPCKRAGQGFGSPTGQYMELYICYDTRTLTGYGLRISRTTRHANAVEMQLMEYRHGQGRAISSAVATTCFITGCTISLDVSDHQLSAHVATTSPQRESPLAREVHLSAPLAPTADNKKPAPAWGTGLLYTGTVGSAATMLHEWRVVWR